MEVSKTNSVNFGQVFYTKLGKKVFQSTAKQLFAKSLFKEIADQPFKVMAERLDKEVGVDLYFIENSNGNVYLEMRKKAEKAFDNYRGEYVFSDDIQMTSSPTDEKRICSQVTAFFNFCTEYYLAKRKIK